MNFQGIIVILMPGSITLSFYRQQKDVLGGINCQKCPKSIFKIKFINIAIYCNTFFNIAIYRNTFFGPQYPALIFNAFDVVWQAVSVFKQEMLTNCTPFEFLFPGFFQWGSS